MNIVLFDMDGTLTPSREIIRQNMVKTIQELLKKARVGIVTGSGFEYVKEQCHTLLYCDKTNRNNLAIFPCNGTQTYQFLEGSWTRTRSADMKQQLGSKKFKEIVSSILSLQLKLVDEHAELPLSGTFIQYRKSLLNWCPMGRDYGDKDRKKFIALDQVSGIREELISKLNKKINQGSNDITLALGGECSIDIYPKGWNKTYCLKQLTGYKDIYFVGDRCEKGGNDYHIYKKLNNQNTAYKTSGPADTIRIIKEIITPMLK